MQKPNKCNSCKQIPNMAETYKNGKKMGWRLRCNCPQRIAGQSLPQIIQKWNLENGTNLTFIRYNQPQDKWESMGEITHAITDNSR